jgi:type IV secretory pathway VirB10-like protein
MTTRIEIIAQIDVEINRLQRARDFLTAALAGSKNDSRTASAIASLKKAKTKVPAQKPRQPALAAAPAAIIAPPPPPQPKEEPQIRRVPPRRRMERRHLQTEKHAKSGAALSGLVPTGPVAVSADEARKVQERVVQPPSPPVVSELRSEIGAERSLGSLIQAFERRAGLSGLETP